MQTQSQTEHVLDVLHSGSGGRVQKMQQNTQAMEDQYKGLLQNIVNSGSMNDPATGKPWLPSADFFSIVAQQFTTLKNELEAEKTANEGILQDAHDAITKCNTDRANSFSKGGGVVDLKGTMQTDRGEHSSCRGDEDNKIDDMESKCAAFDELAAKCDDNQDWYAQYNDASVNVPGSENTLQEVVSKATACKGSVDVVTDVASTCDGKQDDFKAAYCAYEKDLSKVCKDHAACYKTQKANYEGSEKSVKALEIEQKTIWRMVGKVQCYLDALMNAKENSMPTQAEITHCSSTPIDDSALTIVYTTVAAEDACMEHPDLGGEHASANNRPGKDGWYDTEMTGLTKHNKLNENSACR